MNDRMKTLVLVSLLVPGLQACGTMDADMAAMMGAVGGMAAVGAYGGSADMMMQGAAIGAGVTGGSSSVAQGLASSTGVYSNVGLSSPVGQTAAATGSNGGDGPGAVTPGSYPKRDHWLDGSPACSGFTMSNYRTYALSGNPDAQLKTMCGQAYELYSMYSRAVDQGWAEHQANRTYEAYEQAATNARSFYQTSR